MIYLALGDSMSIDKYTGVVGGGAVAQFHKWLGTEWQLLDQTADGCTMDWVDTKATGDLITLTIGGNDALQHMERVMTEGVSFLLQRHRDLLERIRQTNPTSCLIAGNVYSPQTTLPLDLEQMLTQLNAGIEQNIHDVNGYLADIYATFKGHEATHLCQDIEPTLEGATAIAQLFIDQYTQWQSSSGTDPTGH